MSVTATLGFCTSVVAITVACLVVPVFLLFIIRRKCKIDAARKDEIKRLLISASEEYARAEFEAELLFQNDDVCWAAPVNYSRHYCAVCYSVSNKICGRCKAVRYCSGKCQIIHWRQGHKDKCYGPPTSVPDSDKGSGPNMTVAEQQHGDDDGEKMFENEDKQHQKLVETPTEEPALHISDSFLDVSCTGDGNSAANMFADEERPSAAFSGLLPSKTTNESSDDISVDETTNSVDIDMLNSQVSVNDPADSLEATPGADNNDYMKPLCPKFANFVSSAHNLSKLSNSSCGDGESASSVNEFSGLIVAGEKARVASPSLIESYKESLTFRGRTLESFERKDTKSDSATDKISFGIQYSPSSLLDLPENAATESLSEGFKAKKCGSSDVSPATKESTSSRPTCENAPGGNEDSSLRCSMSLCVDHDACKSSPVLNCAELRASVSATPLAHPSIIRDAVNTRASSVNKVFSSGSIRADKLAYGAATITVHLPRTSQDGCTTSTSNTFTTNILEKKSVRIHDRHGVPAISSEVIRRSKSLKNGLRTPASKVVNQFRESKLHKHYPVCPESEAGRSSDKGLFPYETFVKLYIWNKAFLRPCGIINCGNSCYANVVLQCLAFTPPLTAYFIQGLHCKTCIKKSWCFSCEFERVVLKVKEGVSPISPIKILSQLQNVGSHLRNGREEDAHEFLRYGIENMQSVFLTESGLTASITAEEETTLIGLTFGGHLLSKIKCTRCKGKSERQERMMDLTVEIDGDIRTLEEALRQFTRSEILDGENKYHCSRCKAYEKAKKKLTILEAPNVLTIVLKRYQAGRFGKLNKPIRFPEILDMAPYMSGTSDKLHIYRLYAVVVHLDIMNTAFSGHYICYVKNIQNKWFKADDSTVTAVELDEVLKKDAYMLLYARCSPRAPGLVRKKIACPEQKFLSESCGKSTSSKSRPAYTHPDVLLLKSDSAVLDLPCSFDLFSKQPKKILGGELSSDSSSLISSNSDEGSCSTDSTHDSLTTDDFSDNVVGETGGRCVGSPWKFSSNIYTNSSSNSSSPFFKTSIANLDHYASCSSMTSEIQIDHSGSAFRDNHLSYGHHRTSKLVELKDRKNDTFWRCDIDRHGSRILAGKIL